jgi:hypothetical protein
MNQSVRHLKSDLTPAEAKCIYTDTMLLEARASKTWVPKLEIEEPAFFYNRDLPNSINPYSVFGG